MSGRPGVLKSEELPASEAKWVTLKKLQWEDQDGKKRLWECAERKTRKGSGVDAVSILAIIRSEKKSFPPSTVIIEQYRPPVDSFVIELPAGLIDEGETVEQAAIRELEEETGFQSDKILETSDLLASDPGMTTANMKLVMLDVSVPDKLDTSEGAYKQKLEEGEHIVKRIVTLKDLHSTLKDYSSKGFTVDARLSHFAAGYQAALKFSGID